MLRAVAQGGGGTFSTLTVTGQGLFADGTAAAPGMAFSSQTGTGFLQEATRGRVGFSANGTQVARFLEGGGLDLLNDAGTLRFGAAVDTILIRDAASTLALRNGVSAQTLVLGQGNVSLAAGRLQMGRDAAAAFAPGAGRGMLRWEAGTNPNTLKLVAYSGTSVTGVTIVDNVGAGN